MLEAADGATGAYLRAVEFFMDWAGTEARQSARALAEEEEEEGKGRGKGKLSYSLRCYREAVEYTIYDRRFFVTEGGVDGAGGAGGAGRGSGGFCAGGVPAVCVEEVGGWEGGVDYAWGLLSVWVGCV